MDAEERNTPGNYCSYRSRRRTCLVTPVVEKVTIVRHRQGRTEVVRLWLCQYHSDERASRAADV